jgi:hypothetical protein
MPKPDWIDFHPDPRLPRRRGGLGLGWWIGVFAVVVTVIAVVGLVSLVVLVQLTRVLP